MRQFQLLAGMHREGSRVYMPSKTSVVLVESPHDLVALFGREKFAPVGVVENTPVAPASRAPTLVHPNGEIATDEFDGADELGLVIFEKGGWFQVYQGNAPDPLNPKRLRREAVEELVENMSASKH